MQILQRRYWTIPVKHKLQVVVKPQPIDLTNVYRYFGELYDGGKKVYGTFAHPDAERAKSEVVEWAKDHYKLIGIVREGR